MARTATKPKPTAPAAIPDLRMVPIEQIVPHPNNIRRDVGDVSELAASITEHGVLEPLLVVPIANISDEYLRAAGDPDTVVVVAGHRRLAAAQVAMVTELPCLVRADLGDATAVTLAMLVENLQRTDLSPIEEAAAYHQLELGGMKVGQIVSATGRSRSTVDSRLKLLKLPETIRERIHAHQVSLDEAAVLGEFSRDQAALDRLEACLGTNNWDYQVRDERTKARRAAEMDAMRAQLVKRGVRVVELGYPTWKIGGGEHPESGLLRELGFEPQWWAGAAHDLGEAPDPSSPGVTWPDHEACAGHAAVVHTSQTVIWVCTTAQAHLTAQEGDEGGGETAGSGEVEIDPQVLAAREAALQRRAEIEAREQALSTAREVRLVWLRSLVTGAKALPKEFPGLIARHVTDQVAAEVEFFPRGADILSVLGVDTEDIDFDLLEELARRELKARDPHRSLLAVAAAVQEDGSQRMHTWTNVWSGQHLRDWLRLLVTLGYTPSDIEVELMVDPVAEVTGEPAGREIVDVPTGDVL